MRGITRKQLPSTAGIPRGSLSKGDFDGTLVAQGYSVVHEKAIQCPCKGQGTDNLSDCQNCGGSGWVFINPTLTKMLVQQMNLSKKYQDIGDMSYGTASITALASDRLSFMDRITLLDAESTISEVVHFDTKGDQLFSYTSYNIKDVHYIALYDQQNKPLRQLTLGDDYTYKGNAIVLSEEFLNVYDRLQEIGYPLSMTIRYLYAPQYHITMMGRDSMESTLLQGRKESTQEMLVNAMGRKSENIENAPGLRQTLSSNVTFIEECCLGEELSKQEKLVKNITSNDLFNLLTDRQKMELNNILNP